MLTKRRKRAEAIFVCGALWSQMFNSATCRWFVPQFLGHLASKSNGIKI